VTGADVVRHHFTVDVEEYFHPTVMSPHYPMAAWEGLPRRSPEVIPRILDFLAERKVQGTFFVLGWLAEQEPTVVEAIARAGHEVASHGWEHELVARLGPERFRASVRRSKQVLEDVTGRRVLGYRAPSFSILPGMEWAFDVLLEEGYAYDASLFPITQHPVYGYPGAERYPFVIRRPAGVLAEVPAATARILGKIVPAAGGAYFRLLPSALVRAGFREAGQRGLPATFYIHPWELDGWAPDVAAPRVARFRTFGGRTRTWRRLERLLGEFAFGRVDSSVERLLADPEVAP
jgi:polysaccharide deacetylase family protein (PEP-CTERM system associated)